MSTTSTSRQSTSDPRETVLITGCSSGIGLALAQDFHTKNYRVFATARSTTSLTSLASLGIETFPLELQSASSITALRDAVDAATNGAGLDYLVNNAGRNLTVPAMDLDIDDVRDCFETNVFAVMRMCQAFVPLLIRRKGTVVMIGSLAGVMPYVFGSAYNASKAALHGYADTLRVELAPLGVRVTTIVTGGVQSQLSRLERHLPTDSLYLPINDEYQRRLKYSQVGAMPAEEYARSVVRHVTVRGSKPLHVWEGNKAWVVWAIKSFLPAWVMDIVFTRMFKLWKLKDGRDGSKAKSA